PSSSLGSATAQGISFVEPGTNDQPTAIFMAAKSPSDLNAQLAAAQQAVLTAQKNVDAARADAASSLQSPPRICAAVGASPNPPGGSGSTTTTTSPTGPIAACQDALNDVLDAQTAVSEAQSALVDASNQLDQVLQKIEAT